MTLEWLRQKSESTDLLTIMKGWWSEGKFRAKSASAKWKTSKFRKSVQIILILLSEFFRREDGSTFPDKWIPIIYQVITSRSTLNWGELISSNLDLQLKKVQKNTSFSCLHTYWMWYVPAESILLLVGDGSLTFHQSMSIAKCYGKNI